MQYVEYLIVYITYAVCISIIYSIYISYMEDLGGIESLGCGLVAAECFAAVLFVSDFLQEQVESIQMNSTLVETCPS